MFPPSRVRHKSPVIALYFPAAPGHPADKLDLRATADRLLRGDTVGDLGSDAASSAQSYPGDQSAGSRGRLSAPGNRREAETRPARFSFAVRFAPHGKRLGRECHAE